MKSLNASCHRPAIKYIPAKNLSIRPRCLILVLSLSARDIEPVFVVLGRVDEKLLPVGDESPLPPLPVLECIGLNDTLTRFDGRIGCSNSLTTGDLNDPIWRAIMKIASSARKSVVISHMVVPKLVIGEIFDERIGIMSSVRTSASSAGTPNTRILWIKGPGYVLRSFFNFSCNCSGLT